MAKKVYTSSEGIKLALQPEVPLVLPPPPPPPPMPIQRQPPPDYAPLIKPSAIKRFNTISSFPAGSAAQYALARNRMLDQRRVISPAPASRQPPVEYAVHSKVPKDPRAHASSSMSRRQGSFGRRSVREPIIPAQSANPGLPYYFSLTDPHLQEFYARKFGLNPDKFLKPAKCSSKGEETLYKVIVVIGEQEGSGTTANLFIRINGRSIRVPKQKLTKKSGLVKTPEGKRYRFHSGSENVFKFKGPCIKSMNSVVIESDGLRVKEGCFIDEIYVTNLRTKQEWLFPANCWLSLYESDCQTSRELFPQNVPKKVTATEYTVEVVTGDLDGAGTDANVFVTLYGQNGVTPRLQLYDGDNDDPFEAGQIDNFILKTKDVGKLKKLRVEHDNTGMASGWYLDSITLINNRSDKSWLFQCDQWLAKNEGDGRICRDLVAVDGDEDGSDGSESRSAKYSITTYTGSKRGGGTDANVFIALFGKKGDSTEIQLKGSGNLFEKGNKDVFNHKLPYLGSLESIRIRHDNSGVGAGWFLDKVVINDGKKDYEFKCGKWLSKTEGDGKISRDLQCSSSDHHHHRSSKSGGSSKDMTVYKLTFRTGNVRYAGTKANVWVELNAGKKAKNRGRSSGKLWVEGTFDRGGTDVIKLDGPSGLSPLESIDVGHDNSGSGAGWFLEQVTVECGETGCEQSFPCHKWLATDEGDGQIQRTLHEDKQRRAKRDKKHQYSVFVHTSDKRGAGTDANVFLTLYGADGKSDKYPLKSQSDAFERGQTDEFQMEAGDIGDLYKARIEHDNEGRGAGWHLDSIDVEDNESGKKYHFPCGRWLADNEDDKEIIRELPANAKHIKKPRKVVDYSVKVTTGKKFGAGTDADVYCCLFGEYGDTGERPLKHSLTNRNKFERGQSDVFHVQAVDLGALDSLIIGHNGEGAGAGWYLEEVIVEKESGDDRKGDKGPVKFGCGRWLAEDEDDGAIQRQLYPSDSDRRRGNNKNMVRRQSSHQDLLKSKTYNLEVKTGDVASGGTKANVYIILYGQKGETSRIRLGKSVNNRSATFQRGKIDLFDLEADDIGKVKKLVIGHDGKGMGAGWYLDWIRLQTAHNGAEYQFHADRWLAKDEDDGSIEIELYPDQVQKHSDHIPYELTVETGDLKGAGTDANVFCQIYGENGRKTDNFHLTNHTDNFERGTEDVFKMDGVDVGRIIKIRVSTDGKGVGSGWFLQRVIIRKPKTHSSKKASRSSLRRSSSAVSFKNLGVGRRKSSRSRRSSGDDSDSVSSSNDGKSKRPNKRSSSVDDDSLHYHRGERKKGKAIMTKYRDESSSDADKGDSNAGYRRPRSASARSGREKHRRKSSAHSRGSGRSSSSSDVVGGRPRRRSSTHHAGKRDKYKSGDSEDEDDNLNGRRRKSSKQRPSSARKPSSARPGSSGQKQSTMERLRADMKKKDKTKRSSSASEDSSDWSGSNDGKKDGRRRKKSHEKQGRSESDSNRSRTTDESNEFSFDSDEQPGPSNRRKNSSRQQQLSESLRKESEKRDRKEALRRGSVAMLKGERRKSSQAPGHNRSMKGSKSARNRRDTDKDTEDDESDSEQRQTGSRKDSSVSLRVGSSTKRSKSADRNDGRHHSDDDNRARKSSKHRDEEEFETYYFVCGRWFAKGEDDGKLIRELFPTDEHGRPSKHALEEHNYQVHVFTGNVSGAGTDANVFLTLYGENGDSGERQLDKSDSNRNKFERNQEDVFNIQACDLGKLRKVKIWHDNSGMGAAWFLDKVEVVDRSSGKQLDSFGTSQKKYLFPCEKWFSTKKDDGQICRELIPVSKGQMRRLTASSRRGSVKDELGLEISREVSHYVVRVKTGSVRGGGTDANVYIVLYGEEDDSGQIFLKSSTTNRNKFESDQTDEFHVEAAHLGLLQKILIGHDNAGGFSDWFLEWVEVDCPTSGVKWHFPCERWLAKKKEDGRLERELYPADDETQEYEPCIPYEVIVETSDKRGAGTEADVFISLQNHRGVATRQISLCSNKNERKEKFNRGSQDKFIVELEDIGDKIKRLRVGHDGSNWGAGWHLKQIILKKLLKNAEGQMVYTFPCDKWLAKDEDDGAIVRDLIPSNVFKQTVQRDGSVKSTPLIKSDPNQVKEYEIRVETGDKSGAGTDANVFINVFGRNGEESGVRQLKQSQTHRNKFEKGNTDVFLFEIQDLGDIFKIQLSHDDSLIKSDWYVEKVEITDLQTQQVSSFDCQEWLAKTPDGDCTTRSFFVQGYNSRREREESSDEGRNRDNRKLKGGSQRDSLKNSSSDDNDSWTNKASTSSSKRKGGRRNSFDDSESDNSWKKGSRGGRTNNGKTGSSDDFDEQDPLHSTATSSASKNSKNNKAASTNRNKDRTVPKMSFCGLR